MLKLLGPQMTAARRLTWLVGVTKATSLTKNVNHPASSNIRGNVTLSIVVHWLSF